MKTIQENSDNIIPLHLATYQSHEPLFTEGVTLRKKSSQSDLEQYFSVGQQDQLSKRNSNLKIVEKNITTSCKSHT